MFTCVYVRGHTGTTATLDACGKQSTNVPCEHNFVRSAQCSLVTIVDVAQHTLIAGSQEGHRQRLGDHD